MAGLHAYINNFWRPTYPNGNLMPPCRSVSEVKRYFKPLTFQFGWKWLVSSVKMRIPPEGYLVVNVSYTFPCILVIVREHFMVAFPI